MKNFSKTNHLTAKFFVVFGIARNSGFVCLFTLSWKIIPFRILRFFGADESIDARSQIHLRIFPKEAPCGNMAQLNFLFALMLAFVSYPSNYGVAIGDNDKSEKEEKAEKKTEVRLNDFVAHFQGMACSRLTVFLVILLVSLSTSHMQNEAIKNNEHMNLKITRSKKTVTQSEVLAAWPFLHPTTHLIATSH